jgi:hypothetical protein
MKHATDSTCTPFSLHQWAITAVLCPPTARHLHACATVLTLQIILASTQDKLVAYVAHKICDDAPNA